MFVMKNQQFVKSSFLISICNKYISINTVYVMIYNSKMFMQKFLKPFINNVSDFCFITCRLTHACIHIKCIYHACIYIQNYIELDNIAQICTNIQYVHVTLYRLTLMYPHLSLSKLIIYANTCTHYRRQYRKAGGTDFLVDLFLDKILRFTAPPSSE